MGKASSSKKIKRVQAAGATRSPGQRRQLGFPALIAAIIVLGLVGTAFAVAHRRTNEEVRPVVGDNWVAAYGTYICGEAFNLGNLDNVVEDAPVDLHADGLIHIHPTDEENSGAGAVFGLFLESVGITVGDGTLTLPPSDLYPEGKTFTDGDECPGEDGGEPQEGRVALYQWPPQAGENTDPRIITTNIAGTRFTEDGQTYVLAFAPRGAEIGFPPSHDRIDDPDDTEPEVVDSSSTTTTPSTTAAPDTSAPEPTDTTPGG
ncbi:MAG: hypothetical protein M9942_06760 [Microthrixaceae bacterium]|nr:hypothetical protein [Microthrixaceae bacterium]MCO5318124.1 hypothetical protein [Microthrixaceae bacterium]